jgi:hypothetical protein
LKTRHFIPGSVVQIVALAGLAAALSATGCDRRTPSAKAVSSSSTKLQTVLSSSSTRTEESGKTFARDQYTKVIDSVHQAGDDGLAGEAAAAKLLAAESQLGLTEQPLDTATRLENQADNAATVLRSVLSSWIAENAAADAASLYDPSKNIADAQKSAADFDAQTAEASGRRDKLADQIKALESQAGAKMQQVVAEETELAKIRDHAAGVKATEAAKLIEQAAERRKSADKVRTEASLLQAQADQLQPQFREAELLVQQYKAQARTYRNLIDEMQTRLTAKQAEVEKARAAAGAAAQEIDSQVKELSELRSGALAEAYSSTFQVFSAASQAVTGAKQDQELSVAKVTDGNIKQGLGDAHWSQAQGFLRFEGLLRRLADVKPPLPNAAAYAEQAEQAAKSAAEALESAKSAYESAAAAYGGVRVRGDARRPAQAPGQQARGDFQDHRRPEHGRARLACRRHLQAQRGARRRCPRAAGGNSRCRARRERSQRRPHVGGRFAAQRHPLRRSGRAGEHGVRRAPRSRRSSSASSPSSAPCSSSMPRARRSSRPGSPSGSRAWPRPWASRAPSTAPLSPG